MPAFRLWTLLVSLAIHGALLLLILHSWENEGAKDMGVGGIEVALSPAGSATGSIAAEIPVAKTPQPFETTAPVEAVVPAEEVESTVPEFVEAAPAPEPATSPSAEASDPVPDALEPVPPSETQPVPPEVAETALVPEPATAPARQVGDVSPPAAELPSAVTESPPAPPVEAARPEPPPERETAPGIAQARSPEPEAVASWQPPTVLPSPAKPAPPDPSTTAAEPAEPASAAASEPGAAGRAGMGEEAAVGADAGGPGGGAPGISPDYLDLLRAWLERHKQYPRRARLRRQEGTALLHFVIDRDGQVLSYRIERSSGHAALDAAVEAMLERARPLPAMPPDMAQARLELSVPVTFELQ